MCGYRLHQPEQAAVTSAAARGVLTAELCPLTDLQAGRPGSRTRPAAPPEASPWTGTRGLLPVWPPAVLSLCPNAILLRAPLSHRAKAHPHDLVLKEPPL